jgi:hypothetical protein
MKTETGSGMKPPTIDAKTGMAHAEEQAWYMQKTGMAHADNRHGACVRVAAMFLSD